MHGQRRGKRAGWTAALWVALAACAGDPEGTRIEVTVESDLPADALDEARVEVRGSGPDVEETRADLELEPLPRLVTLVPGERDLAAPVHVRAVGLLAGEEVIAQADQTLFSEGRTVRLTLRLSADCLDVDCDPTETCRGGRCVEVEVPSEDAGTDADAGDDYCEVDGEPRDCSGMDDRCQQGVCDAEARACVAEPVDDGEACGDEGGECRDGTCSRAIDCGGAADCGASCGAGDTCDIDCRGATSCTPTCSGGATCDIDCGGASRCRVRCRGGDTVCQLSCSGADDCEFQQCGGGQQSCPGDVIVCGRDCP